MSYERTLANRLISGGIERLRDVGGLVKRVLGITTAAEIASLTLFLRNLLFAVLWYALVFNGWGTVNPSWLNVFG
jgi:hypothetical protein